MASFQAERILDSRLEQGHQRAHTSPRSAKVSGEKGISIRSFLLQRIQSLSLKFVRMRRRGAPYKKAEVVARLLAHLEDQKPTEASSGIEDFSM